MSATYVRNTHRNEVEHRREIADRLNDAINGNLNISGTVTFSVGTTSTTLTDPRLNQGSVVLLSPTNAKAQATTWYVSAKADGSVTFTHPSIATTDAEYDFVAVY